MNVADGFVVLHLHAHLPDVRRPDDWAEDWFHQAVVETYLPLIERAESWLRDGIEARVGVSVSPPLAAMLSDPELVRRTDRRLEALIRLSRGLVSDATFGKTLRHLGETLEHRQHRFRSHGLCLTEALKRLEEAGLLELGTSGASHGLFPLLWSLDPGLVRSQLRVAMRRHRRLFGRDPTGFWLPECAYGEALDGALWEEGVSHFFVEAHAAEGAAFGTYSPLLCSSGAVAFPRDPECAIRVWGPEVGYPGDVRYREFHRDLGRELMPSRLEDAGLPGDGRPLGLKVHRVTDRRMAARDKRIYDPVEGQRAAEEHAEDFVQMLSVRARSFRERTGRPAVITAPFDAELFGHWWFEGPLFLDRVVRRLARHRSLVLASAADVIATRPPLEQRSPRASTWGRGGHSGTWLNPSNHWVQDEVADAARRLRDAIRRSDSNPDIERLLDAMTQELLGMTASDWPFLMTGGAFADYAERRVQAHVEAFSRLEAGLIAPESGATSGSLDVDHRDLLDESSA